MFGDEDLEGEMPQVIAALLILANKYKEMPLTHLQSSSLGDWGS